jgi:hypothetical protein
MVNRQTAKHTLQTILILLLDLCSGLPWSPVFRVDNQLAKHYLKKNRLLLGTQENNKLHNV